MRHSITTTTSTARHRVRTAIAGLVLGVLLTGCGGARTEASSTPTTTAPASSPVTATEVTASAQTTTVARAQGELAVHDAPGDPEPARTLAAATSYGTPTVLLVSQVGAGDADGWLQVLLPVRPNGATGWIRADDVELQDVRLEIEVDLAARELTVLDGGDELLTTATAIGEDANPTPTGRFFVVDKLETPDPAGAYGPYAIGLSAHSETLSEFGGGDGQIGIHGTNAPDSIGRAVSHGCMRVANDVIERLAHLLPLGTPVTIV